MPWNKRDDMSLKQEFLEKALTNSYQISSLCREFDISRKTAYKWIRRFKEEGLKGLEDSSRRPLTSPYRLSDDVVYLLLETRAQFPAWGGRKLRQYLLNLGKQNIPCEKTINRILLRHNYIEPQESQKRKAFIRFEKEFPNDLWQMDFKGHFKIQDAGRCHPLTVLDDHSRYSICIKACSSENTLAVKTALEEAFYTYGLPNAMTMDNGSPWKGSPPWHLSRLTVWLMRLGIKISHSTPRHPQTQGKDERFHRSLKDEVLKYHQFSNLAEAQVRFNEWREIYNNIRPHEGIGLECPVSRYKPSLKRFPEKLPAIEYPPEDEVRKVGPCGTINFKGKAYFLGEHLYKEYVGLKAYKEGIYDVYFSTTKIQRLDCR